jgi:beta-phosphoglucomutase-like phosphatase (HAD superfamily)
MEAIDAILFEPVGCLAESPEAAIYEDVIPALSELKSMGVELVICSRLAAAAATRFVERLAPVKFAGVFCGDDSLLRAVEALALDPARTMFLTATAEGLKAARTAGVHGILMMNDPDESRRLAAHQPSGGIVSLHELPDFIRLLRARGVS